MIDVSAMIDRYNQRARFTFRDPLLPPYGEEKRMTKTQKKAHRFFNARIEQEKPAFIAIVGAKGSAKTHFCASMALTMCQRYPGTVGLVMSQSYTQTKDNAGRTLIRLARQIDLGIEFFEKKKVRGEPLASVFVITLPNGRQSFIALRSYDAINKIEGFEPDWFYSEEIQHTPPDGFATAYSRIRGKGAPNCMFIAGMSDEEAHWMYKQLPGLQFVEEHLVNDRIQECYAAGIPLDVPGILYEPPLIENKINLPEGYIERLERIYSAEMAKMMIYGKRGSIRTGKVFDQFRSFYHQTGRMSKVLCDYNPALPIVMSIDFNVAPVSIGLWQKKAWSDAWNDLHIHISSGGQIVHTDYDQDEAENVGEGYEPTITHYASFEDFAPANRHVYAQIGEYETWEGGTRAAMREFKADYESHMGGVVVLGDAAGNQSRSSASTTDWDIVAEELSTMYNVDVVRGIMSSTDTRSGRVKYSNPPIKASVVVANNMLFDAEGRVNVCFLPESKLLSGGVASSVSVMGWLPDGSGMDKKADRRTGKETVRSHHSDHFRYFAVHWNGGVMMQSDAMQRTSFRTVKMVNDAMREKKAPPKTSDVGAIGILAKHKANFSMF